MSCSWKNSNDDDDVQPLFVKYAHPFTDTILSPSSLIGHRKSKKTITLDWYKEITTSKEKVKELELNGKMLNF